MNVGALASLAIIAASGCGATPLAPQRCVAGAVAIALPTTDACGILPKCRAEGGPVTVPPGFERAETAFAAMAEHEIDPGPVPDAAHLEAAILAAVAARYTALQAVVDRYIDAAHDPMTRSFALSRSADLYDALASAPRPWLANPLPADPDARRTFEEMVAGVEDAHACTLYCNAWRLYSEALVHDPRNRRAAAQLAAYGSEFGERCDAGELGVSESSTR